MSATEREQAYHKGYLTALDASRGTCVPLAKGADGGVVCSACGSDGIVRGWAESRGWGGEHMRMSARLWKYCPNCGAKILEVGA